MTYSFDVFDTCLCRLCGEPRMLVDVLSQKVVDMMDTPAGNREHLRQKFVEYRNDCHGDLHTVYSCIAKHFPLPKPVEEMVQLEMQTEREMLVPIRATLALVERCRTKGDGHVIYISDMYLPSAFIEERLRAFGFMKDGDRLYVSDEVQAWKRDGSLFRYVKEQLGLDYRRWHHYGDSRVNDVLSPRRLGIHAHRVHYDFLPIEKKWQRIPLAGFQYANIMAGISRATRLQSGADSDMADFVADIAAPVVAMWTMRVLADAQARGISRLYFFARDCYAEYHLAKHLRQHFPGVEPRYLFVSSASLYTEQEARLDYFIQEQLADHQSRTAIVDSFSTGRGAQAVNDELSSHGYPKADCYLLWFGNAYFSRTDCSYSTTAEIEEFYSGFMASPEVSKNVGGGRKFIELLFPLNFHSRTVGYRRRKDGRIGPVFDHQQNGDDISVPNFRAVKRQCYSLYTSYAQAACLCQLHRFARECLHTVAIPTFGRFLLRPDHICTRYLHRFHYDGQPYVNRLAPSALLGHRYTWLMGSVAHTLPQPLLNIVWTILYSNAFRRLGKAMRLAKGIIRKK